MANQIKLGAIFSYISIFLNILIGICFTPWVIRSIGQSQYGLYTLAMSCITFFAMDFGLGNAVMRFISKFRAEEKESDIDKFIGIVFKLYLVIDFIILLSLLVLYFFIPAIYKGLTPGELAEFKIVFLIAAAFCIFSFPFIPQNAIISSYEKFIWLKTCEILHKIVIVVLLTLCLFLNFGLYSLVLANVVAGIVTILLKLYIIKKETHIKIEWRFWDKNLFKQITTFSIWITITVVAQRFIFNIAPSILGIFSDAAAIAILGVAITVEGYVYTLGSAISGMFMPRTAVLVARNDRQGIMGLMIKVGRLEILLLGLIIIGFVFVGQNFIRLWLGEDFTSVYLCVILLIIPSFFQIPLEICATLIVVKNKVKVQAYAYIVMAVACIIISSLLAKPYGALGISIAVFLAYTVRTIVLNIIYARQLDVSMFEFYRQTYVKIASGLIVSFILCYFLKYINFCDGWLRLGLDIFFISLIYLTVQWFLCMNRDEKNLILDLLRVKTRLLT